MCYNRQKQCENIHVHTFSHLYIQRKVVKLMSETKKIERASSRKREPRKPKKSQIPFALVATMILIVIGIYLNSRSTTIAVFWILGIAFGYTLQRSRFCFTAGFRDPCITRGTSVTRAILVAFAIGSVGFAAIKFAPILTGAEENLNMVGVFPIGIPLMLGAVVFGIGMVIAGGCASGNLMRVGEGFTMQMLALVFFVFGNFLGAIHSGFWGDFSSVEVFLPDVFGWFGSLIVQLAIIVLLYIAAVKWEQKKTKANE